VVEEKKSESRTITVTYKKRESDLSIAKRENSAPYLASIQEKEKWQEPIVVAQPDVSVCERVCF
jgi:hypothetical protein